MFKFIERYKKKKEIANRLMGFDITRLFVQQKIHQLIIKLELKEESLKMYNKSSNEYKVKEMQIEKLEKEILYNNMYLDMLEKAIVKNAAEFEKYKSIWGK